jgi:hypothetical protein
MRFITQDELRQRVPPILRDGECLTIHTFLADGSVAPVLDGYGFREVLTGDAAVDAAWDSQSEYLRTAYMDADQRAAEGATRAIPAGVDPRDIAFEETGRWLKDAWRTPAAQPTVISRDSHEQRFAPLPAMQVPQNFADAGRARDEAWDAEGRRLADAWRNAS